MSDDLETTDAEQPPDNSVIQELRQKAKRADDAESKAADLEQRLALSEAGLTGLTDEQKDALRAVHKDEWNAESLKATAGRLWPGQAGTDAATEPKIDPAELAAMQRVASAAGGIAPSGSLTDEQLQAAIREADGEAATIAALREAGLTSS